MEVLTGLEIRNIREKELHMSLRRFSREIEYTRRAVMNIEAGLSKPRKWFFERLSWLRRTFASYPVIVKFRKKASEFQKRMSLIKARGSRSQPEIAKAIGVSDSLISLWELGKVVPPKNRMEQLEKLFGISREILFPDVYESNNAMAA